MESNSLNKAIIIGGNYKNKGAQAMVLATASEIYKRCPDCEIFMFSYFEENITIPPIKIVNWNRRNIFNLLLHSMGFIFNRKLSLQEQLIYKHLTTTDIIFDVSGFALSSQFEFKRSLNYVFIILLAQKYNRRIVLLPQSFGPFDYKWWQKLVLLPMIKFVLKYPEKIYARESKGYEQLRKYTRDNLERSLDLVLLTEKPLIRTGQNVINRFDSNNNVAIIPNVKLLRWGNKDDIFAMYRKIVNRLLEADYNVVILRHSYEDKDMCQQIYQDYNNNFRVKLYDDDYDCVSLYEIISQMEFVIASRYHSLVHSLKAGLPVMAIGWAEKYQELMQYFNLSEYFHDVRGLLNIETIISSLDKMILTHHQIRSVIKAKKDEIDNEKKLFDQIFQIGD